MYLSAVEEVGRELEPCEVEVRVDSIGEVCRCSLDPEAVLSPLLLPLNSLSLFCLAVELILTFDYCGLKIKSREESNLGEALASYRPEEEDKKEGLGAYSNWKQVSHHL